MNQNLNSQNGAIRVCVPASSANLGPGFDCLGLALQLYNHVSISASQIGAHQITATGEGADSLGEIENNIAFIAVQHLCKYLQVDFGPLHLHLENQIPFARGLGSSSAARVGALVAANEWAKQQFDKSATREEILHLATALEGHADNVAAAQVGGLTIAGEFEQRAISQQFTVPKWPQFIVFIPDAQLETKVARDVLPAQFPRADAVFNVGATAMLLAALQNGVWDYLRATLCDRLHQPFRAPLIPAFAVLQQHFASNFGVLGVTISGAGPTVLLWLHPDANALQVLAEVEQTTRTAKNNGRALLLAVDLEGCILD